MGYPPIQSRAPPLSSLREGSLMRPEEPFAFEIQMHFKVKAKVDF